MTVPRVSHSPLSSDLSLCCILHGPPLFTILLFTSSHSSVCTLPPPKVKNLSNESVPDKLHHCRSTSELTSFHCGTSIDPFLVRSLSSLVHVSRPDSVLTGTVSNTYGSSDLTSPTPSFTILYSSHSVAPGSTPSRGNI